MQRNTKIGVAIGAGLISLGLLAFGGYYLYKRGGNIGEDNSKPDDHYAFKFLSKKREKFADDKEKLPEYQKIDCDIKNNEQMKLFDAFFTVIKQNQAEAEQFTKAEIEEKNKLLLVLQEIVCHAFAITKKDGKINFKKYEDHYIEKNEEYKKLKKDKKKVELKKKVSAEILTELKGYLTDGENNKIYKAYKEKDAEIQKEEEISDEDKKKKEEEAKKNK
ncbi:hypothetical protein BDAP_002310 [Binucleata daphniae]